MKRNEVEKIQKIELTLWNDLTRAERVFGMKSKYTNNIRNRWAGAHTILAALGVKTLGH